MVVAVNINGPTSETSHDGELYANICRRRGRRNNWKQLAKELLVEYAELVQKHQGIHFMNEEVRLILKAFFCSVYVQQ